jgi:hypothetical protein
MACQCDTVTDIELKKVWFWGWAYFQWKSSIPSKDFKSVSCVTSANPVNGHFEAVAIHGACALRTRPYGRLSEK